MSLLGGSFSAQSWLIVHPPCPFAGENHTRLFHTDTKGRRGAVGCPWGPWSLRLGPGNSLLSLTPGKGYYWWWWWGQLKNNLGMSHKSYMLLLEKFSKCRYAKRGSIKNHLQSLNPAIVTFSIFGVILFIGFWISLLVLFCLFLTVCIICLNVNILYIYIYIHIHTHIITF